MHVKGKNVEPCVFPTVFFLDHVFLLLTCINPLVVIYFLSLKGSSWLRKPRLGKSCILNAWSLWGSNFRLSEKLPRRQSTENQLRWERIVRFSQWLDSREYPCFTTSDRQIRKQKRFTIPLACFSVRSCYPEMKKYSGGCGISRDIIFCFTPLELESYMNS